MAGAALFHQRDEQIRQGQRLAADGFHGRLRKDLQAAFDQGQRDDGLRAAQGAGDAVGGRKARIHGERRSVAPPAGQRLAEARLVFFGYPDEGGRAWAAVQVLIGAANGQVGAGAVQVQRHGAGRMGQVPQRQRALRVAMAADGCHVVLVAGTVVDVREHGDGTIGGYGLRQLLGAVDQAQLVAAIEPGGKTLRHVQVGREVAAFADDDSARGMRGIAGLHLQGGGQGLEQVDGGGVGDRHFTRAGAQQGGQAVAQALGQVEPAGGIPAADQVGAPFGRDDVLGAGKGRFRPRTQGIAIEVNHALRQVELLAQGRQGIVEIARAAVVSRNHGGFHVDTCLNGMILLEA